MPRSFLIIDDFAANPHEFRRQALNLGYDPATRHGNYPGITSQRALPIKGIDDYVSKAIRTRYRLPRAPSTAIAA